MTYSPHNVHRTHGLLFLLAYAFSHPHSAQWIGAIAILLAREVARG